MFELPLNLASLWLNKLYVSVIDPDRSREAFKKTEAFLNKEFRRKLMDLSDEADRVVFDASFVGDILEIKSFLLGVNPDLLDIIIYRFNLKMAELRNEEGSLYFPAGKPDILAAFRLLLIENDQIRNGPWPKH